MNLATAYLASLVILKTLVTVRYVTLFNKRLPAGLCALLVATALGLLANLALPSVRRALDPRRAIVLFVLPALTYSTVLVSRRAVAVFARVHLLLAITTNMSVTVSTVPFRSSILLNRLSQVVDQSALRAKFRTSTLRRQLTRLSALVVCLVMFFPREPAYKVALRVPSYLPRIT